MDKCCICLESNNLVTLKTCGHRFHYNCIQKWLTFKNTCPICRTIVLKSYIVGIKIKRCIFSIRYNTRLVFHDHYLIFTNHIENIFIPYQDISKIIVKTKKKVVERYVDLIIPRINIYYKQNKKNKKISLRFTSLDDYNKIFEIIKTVYKIN